jgi:hypothetical protein
VATFCQVTRPSTTDDGLYAPGLRFGEQRVMAILAAVVGFCHLIRGFTNSQLVERVGALLQLPYTSRQATYDLRRLKRKGLIAKVAGTQRYQLTSLGRRVAVLFTKTYSRVLAPGRSVLDLRLPPQILKGPQAGQGSTGGSDSHNSQLLFASNIERPGGATLRLISDCRWRI